MHGGRPAVVRYVHDVEPGRVLEQFHRQVRGAGVADRRIVRLARSGPDRCHELAQRTRRILRVYDQHVLLRNGRDDRREALERPVGELREHVRRRRERAVETDEHVMAIGFGAGDVGGGDRPAGTGLVLHENGRAEPLAQPVGDQPRRDVDRAARRGRNDEPHGAGRKVLRARHRRQRGTERKAAEQQSANVIDGHGGDHKST